MWYVTFLRFRLRTKSVECPTEEQLTIYLSIVPNGERNVQFLENGYLKVRNEFYHSDEYCING